MTGVPEHVCTFLTRENQRKPFMYKYYLINSFCIEASNTQESLVLATEFKLVGFFFLGFFLVFLARLYYHLFAVYKIFL